MAHTPGPWHILCRAANPDHSDSWRTIAGDSRPKAYGGQIARVGWSDLSEDETEANARLIAAAPELLEAAKFYVANCPQRSKHDSGTCDGPLCRTFRAVIAKVDK